MAPLLARGTRHTATATTTSASTTNTRAAAGSTTAATTTKSHRRDRNTQNCKTIKSSTATATAAVTALAAAATTTAATTAAASATTTATATRPTGKKQRGRVSGEYRRLTGRSDSARTPSGRVGIHIIENIACPRGLAVIAVITSGSGQTIGQGHRPCDVNQRTTASIEQKRTRFVAQGRAGNCRARSRGTSRLAGLAARAAIFQRVTKTGTTPLAGAGSYATGRPSFPGLSGTTTQAQTTVFTRSGRGIGIATAAADTAHPDILLECASTPEAAHCEHHAVPISGRCMDYAEDIYCDGYETSP